MKFKSLVWIAVGVLVTLAVQHIDFKQKKKAEWSVGLYEGDSPYALTPARGIKNPIVSSKDVTDVDAGFIADPFMVNENGTWYLFFEVLNKGNDQGDVGLATSRDGKTWYYEKIVLDESFHLSYPQVFKSGDSYYMIPESKQSGYVRLYKAVNFPNEWKVVKNLYEGKYVDPSIVHHDGKWWIFALRNNRELTLHYADTLEGEWKEHPLSPLVVDNANITRSGGRIVEYQGKLYRFIQDGIPSYGSQVRVFEIDRMDTERFQEHEIVESPVLEGTGKGWNAKLMHHVDAHLLPDGHWLAVVDASGYVDE